MLVGMLPLVAVADHQDDTVEQTTGAPENQPGYWVNYLATVRGIEDAVCTKINESGNEAFVMPDEDDVAGHEGGDWVLLVVKQATTNYVFYDPIAGESYASHQGGGGYSHLIVCSVEFVPVGILAVSKDAAASYDLEHLWDIDKNAAQTLLQLPADGSGDGSITWTVDVTYEGSETSNGAVTGSITLDNSASNVAVEIDSITDTLSSGETATVTCPDDLPFVIPAGGSVTCTYEAATDSIEDGTNSVDVTGQFDDDDDPNNGINGEAIDNDPATADYSFVLDTETNATVNVTDLSSEFGPANLGSVTAPNDGQFTYSEDFSYEGFGGCRELTIDNTATITETGQSATEQVVIESECLVFEGATATGDGLKWRGNVPGSPNTWFEFSPFANTTGTIITGAKRNDIGEFNYDSVEGEICFDLDSPWVFADVAGNAKIEPLDAKPLSYLSPGQFSIHATLSGDSGCVDVPDASYGYAIHLDVGQWVSAGFGS
jgi:hypothetical protein